MDEGAGVLEIGGGEGGERNDNEKCNSRMNEMNVPANFLVDSKLKCNWRKFLACVNWFVTFVTYLFPLVIVWQYKENSFVLVFSLFLCFCLPLSCLICFFASFFVCFLLSFFKKKRKKEKKTETKKQKKERQILIRWFTGPVYADRLISNP